MNGSSICFFNGNKAWGGGEKWNFDFARLMRDRGYRVLAVCNQPSDLGDRLEKEHDVTVLRMKLGNLSFLNPFKQIQLRSFFRNNRVDCLITALPSDLKLAGPAARGAGVPQVIFRRGIAVPTKNTALNRYLYGKVITKLICNSEETRRQVLSNNPEIIPLDRTHVLYNGFDVAAFDALPDTPLITRRGDETIIGNAARLTHQKGQMLLLKAVALLRERGHNVRLVIAGTGELEASLNAFIRDNHMDEYAELIGFTNNVKGFHQSLDIFALPSLWEGFGYAMVEAMAAQKPVVAFDDNSMPEVVQDEKTGLLAAPGDIRDFADKLERLVLDPELRERLGQNGRQRVLDTFDTPITLQAFEEVLNA